MGVGDVEAVLKEDTWMSGEEISEATGINNIKPLLRKLVNKWKSVEVKQELINHNWRKFYRLKK